MYDKSRKNYLSNEFIDYTNDLKLMIKKGKLNPIEEEQAKKFIQYYDALLAMVYTFFKIGSSDSSNDVDNSTISGMMENLGNWTDKYGQNYDEEYELLRKEKLRKRFRGKDSEKNSIQKKLLDLGIDIDNYNNEQQLLMFVFIDTICYETTERIIEFFVPIKEKDDLQNVNRRLFQHLSNWNTDTTKLMIKVFCYAELFNRNEVYNRFLEESKNISNLAYETRFDIEKINIEDKFTKAFHDIYVQLLTRSMGVYKSIEKVLVNNNESFSSFEKFANIKIQSSLKEAYIDIDFLKINETALMWIIIFTRVIYDIVDAVCLHSIDCKGINQIETRLNKVHNSCFDYAAEISRIKERVFKSNKSNIFFDFAYAVGIKSVENSINIYLEIIKSVNGDLQKINLDEEILYVENAIESPMVVKTEGLKNLSLEDFIRIKSERFKKMKTDDLMKIFVPLEYHNNSTVKKHLKSRMDIVVILTNIIVLPFKKQIPTLFDYRVMYYALYIRKNSNIANYNISMKTIKSKANYPIEETDLKLTEFEKYWLKEIYISSYLLIDNFKTCSKKYGYMWISRKEIAEVLKKSLGKRLL